jgi:hypothetical protein
MSFSRVSAALVAATIVVTVAVSFLLVEGQSRDGTFYLSLGFILLAEVFLFVGPHLVRTGGGTRMAPWHISMAGIPLGYAIGVAGITIAAVRGTPWRVLVSAQLVWLLLLIIALVIVRATGTRIAAGHTADMANRTSFANAVSLLDDVCHRCELLTRPDVASLLKQLRQLREDVRYSAQDTLPEAVQFDLKLSACFDSINRALLDLERDSSSMAPLEESARQIQIARQALVRREDAIAHMRA